MTLYGASQEPMQKQGLHVPFNYGKQAARAMQVAAAVDQKLAELGLPPVWSMDAATGDLAKASTEHARLNADVVDRERDLRAAEALAADLQADADQLAAQMKAACEAWVASD